MPDPAPARPGGKAPAMPALASCLCGGAVPQTGDLPAACQHSPPADASCPAVPLTAGCEGVSLAPAHPPWPPGRLVRILERSLRC